MRSLSAHPVAKWLIIFILITGVYFFNVFILPVLAAMIIGFATWPTHQNLVHFCRGKTWLSASIMMTLIILVIIVPFFWLCHYLITEAQVGIAWLKNLNSYGSATPPWIKNLPLIGAYLNQVWMDLLSEPYGVSAVARDLGFGRMANLGTYALSLGKNIGGIALALAFMLITLFFFYKDGYKFGIQIDKVGETILPKRWYRISRVVPTMVSSTVTGMVIIAIGEGIVLGFCYWLAGAPSPVTLGILTGFLALIPGGAPLSMSLVSLYLLGSGNSFNGITLFIWGAVELFIVDKTIRPRLVGGPAKLAFLPTFFGLVGGVKTLGIVGLFTGPVVMALLVAIWREWLIDEENEAKNELLKKSSSKNQRQNIEKSGFIDFSKISKKQLIRDKFMRNILKIKNVNKSKDI